MAGLTGRKRDSHAVAREFGKGRYVRHGHSAPIEERCQSQARAQGRVEVANVNAGLPFGCYPQQLVFRAGNG
jgi:hypothetical protein